MRTCLAVVLSGGARLHPDASSIGHHPPGFQPRRRCGPHHPLLISSHHHAQGRRLWHDHGRSHLAPRGGWNGEAIPTGTQPVGVLVWQWPWKQDHIKRTARPLAPGDPATASEPRHGLSGSDQPLPHLADGRGAGASPDGVAGVGGLRCHRNWRGGLVDLVAGVKQTGCGTHSGFFPGLLLLGQNHPEGGTFVGTGFQFEAGIQQFAQPFDDGKPDAFAGEFAGGRIF